MTLQRLLTLAGILLSATALPCTAADPAPAAPGVATTAGTTAVASANVAPTANASTNATTTLATDNPAGQVAATVDAIDPAALEEREKKRQQCQPLTDQAVANDMKAALAQSQKKTLQEIAKLYGEATRLWESAADACEGNARERARRNLADSSHARDAVKLAQGAGVQCESSSRDASAMHDLAKQASTDRRWQDAAMLYRKSADMWDMAGERCSGPLAQQAVARRTEAATDGFNAQYCAPLFEQARDKTVQMKAGDVAAPREVKIEQSRAVEILWREAANQCQGSASDVAYNNAQRVAKERGSPLPVPIARVEARQPGATGTIATGTIANPPQKPTIVASGAATIAAAPAPGAGKSPVMAPAGASLQITNPEQVTERMAGTTRLIGKFKSGPDGAALNGNGKVIWADGSTFEGAMVDGQRTGKGRFVWPNGQLYDGQWNNDTPMGAGMLKFANGDQYEGNVNDGIPQGQGRIVYASGDGYEGSFVKGQPEGQGTMTWKNGNRYGGQWVAGIRQGAGIYTWSNGDQWIGEFAAGQQTANGKLVRKSDEIKEAARDAKS